MIKQIAIVCALSAGSAVAGLNVSNYDDLNEGFLGNSFSYNGVNYREVNSVDGVFPDGNPFVAGGDDINSLGDQFIIENAAFFYNDFPTWGSANNVLTFGSAFIPGDNLSIGALSYMEMGLDAAADYASVDLAFFENGPWGNIVLHFEAYMGNTLVDADTYTMSNLGGRDNAAITNLVVEGGVFDSMRLYATLGNDYTGPRVMMDNLSINTVPAPMSGALFAMCSGVLARRRR
ncbi:MAG: hypothetical protein JJ974_06275 [Phycisphaerales bacterium]|nr:hypothetical protein [Phycisphaerales bacterium]